VAEQALAGSKLRFDVSADVNETAAIVYSAKAQGGQSGVLIIGGGSPKNFVLQTEPQIQEVLGISEKGHDYYLQITDARPDTVVCYVDSTIGLPLLTSYALARRPPRPLKRLYDRRAALLKSLIDEYQKLKADRDARAEAATGGRAT